MPIFISLQRATCGLSACHSSSGNFTLTSVPLTPEEIEKREAGIREEIEVRERLLEAYAALRTQLEQREHPTPEPAIGSASPSIPPPAATQPIAAPEPPPLPKAELPPSPIPEGPRLPEFLKTGRHGSTGRIVAWAIQHMTEDYTLRDIEDFLSRHGGAKSPEAISVVLTRMKRRGEIQETKMGGGRRACVFRKPDIAPPGTKEEGDTPRDAGDAMKETTGEP